MSTASYQKDWKVLHPGRSATYSRRWNKRHPVSVRRARRKWAKANRPKENARYKRWYDRNAIQVLERRKLTPLSVLRQRVARSIRCALSRREVKPVTTTIPLLGCSIGAFMAYLESKFAGGMSWANYGKWEIDHIVPCALFNLEKPEHQRRCFHFSNLQPLWAPINRAKGARLFYESGFLPL